jgi:hypothetical protein
MGKILIETQWLSAREQKLGQDEALAIQGPYYFGQSRGGRRGRGLARPTFNLSHYPRPYGYPQLQVKPPIPGQFRNPRPHTPQPFPQVTQFRGPRPPFTYYAYGREGHIARDYWQQQHNANYTGFDSQITYYLEPSQFNADAVFSNYYDQNWYVDTGASSHLTGDSSNLDLDTYRSSSQTVSTVDGVSHPVQGFGSASVSFWSGSIKLQHILYIPALKRNLVSVVH